MPARPAKATDTRDAVDAFMAALDHPHKPAIERLRALIPAVDPAIAEGIKWNAPSWRTGDWFATTHLRAKDGLMLVLHRGAKVRELPADGVAIDDPRQLLAWLGQDRASITFRDEADLAAKAGALQAILRQWIAHLG